MISDKTPRWRVESFGRLLDRIETGGGPTLRIDGFRGDEKFWPHASDSRCAWDMGAAAVTAAYAENLPPREPDSAPAREAFDFAAQAERIRKKIDQSRGARLGLEDMRRLRRRCALLAHPDRAAAIDRAEAERLMAEINAAIDEAIAHGAGPRRKS